MAQTFPGVATWVAQTVTIKGLPELMAKMESLGADLPEVIKKAIMRCLLIVARTSQTKYLSGPRPHKLGVVTGRLRSSIGNEAKEGILKITEEQGVKVATYTGHVGTRVVYAAQHEDGATITRRFKKKTRYGVYIHTTHFKMPARPFLKTALADSKQKIEEEFNKTIKSELTQRGLI